MRASYTHNKGPRKHRLHAVLDTLVIIAIIAAAALFGWHWLHHQAAPSKVVEGAAVSVPQSTKPAPVLKISEPTFTMQLPSDWKETAEEDTSAVHSITWQATAKNASNRWLTIYIDTIPDTPVNMELPLTAHGNQLTYGQLSGNCSDFTPGGTENTGQAEKLQPKQSVWDGVNFICNLPGVIDNQVGTGSTSGINSVSVTGPAAGTHHYFFLYTDHNISPDYTILLNAIESFRAK